MFYDRIQDAQQSIKASMSANADESLASTENLESKDNIKDEHKRKGRFSLIYSIFISSVVAVIIVDNS